MKFTIVEKKTYLAGLQCTLTSSCAKSPLFFLPNFGLILTVFLTSQPYNFDAVAHIGLIWRGMTVKNFVRIKWTVFEKLEIFIEKSAKKRHDWISSRKFFPTPKTFSARVTALTYRQSCLKQQFVNCIIFNPGKERSIKQR